MRHVRDETRDISDGGAQVDSAVLPSEGRKSKCTFTAGESQGCAVVPWGLTDPGGRDRLTHIIQGDIDASYLGTRSTGCAMPHS